MDDFALTGERRRLQEQIAQLTSRYRALNAEMERRESLRWMLAPRQTTTGTP